MMNLPRPIPILNKNKRKFFFPFLSPFLIQAKAMSFEKNFFFVFVCLLLPIETKLLSVLFVVIRLVVSVNFSSPSLIFPPTLFFSCPSDEMSRERCS